MISSNILLMFVNIISEESPPSKEDSSIFNLVVLLFNIMDTPNTIM